MKDLPQIKLTVLTLEIEQAIEHGTGRLASCLTCGQAWTLKEFARLLLNFINDPKGFVPQALWNVFRRLDPEIQNEIPVEVVNLFRPVKISQ